MPRAMDVERLICMVQEKPELWDTRCNGYHDRPKKDISWEEITKVLFAAMWPKSSVLEREKLVDDVQTRWRSCRDQFRKDLQQGKGKSGSGVGKRRPYMFRQQLMFLRDVLELRPSEDNLEEEEEMEREESSMSIPAPDTPEFQQAAQAETSAAATSSPLSEEATSQTRRQPGKRPAARTKKGPQTPGQEIDARVLEFLSKGRQEDPVESYLKSLTNHLRKVPEERMLRCQSAISIVIESSIPPNDPTDVFTALEKWRLFGNTGASALPPAPPPPARQYQQRPGEYHSPMLYSQDRPPYGGYPPYRSQEQYFSPPAPAAAATTTANPYQTAGTPGPSSAGQPMYPGQPSDHPDSPPPRFYPL